MKPVAVLGLVMVLINASQESGVGGFEFRLVNSDQSSFPPPFINILDYQLPPTHINVAQPPQFVVGIMDPLPWSPWITLLTITLLPTSTDPWCFGLRATDTFFPAELHGLRLRRQSRTGAAPVPLHRG